MAKTKLLGSDKQNREKKVKKEAKAKRKGIGQFFREVIAELKKVSWPTFKSLLIYTGAVLVFVIVVAIITGAFDIGLSKLMELLVS